MWQQDKVSNIDLGINMIHLHKKYIETKQGPCIQDNLDHTNRNDHINQHICLKDKTQYK